MAKLPKKDKVQFASGYASVGGKNVNSLEHGLREMSDCGCGIECKCHGIVTLPIWDANGVAGIVGYGAIYLTSLDGGTTVSVVAATKEAAETAIDALKP